jgi:hypothetical protein
MLQAIKTFLFYLWICGICFEKIILLIILAKKARERK